MLEFRKNYTVLVPFFILFVLLIPFVLLLERGDGVLYLNGNHTEILDLFFKRSTFLGEGILVAIAGVLALLGKRRLFFVFLLGLVFHFFFIHINKHLLFAHLLRPFGYFESINKVGLLYHVPGINIHLIDTFPSGHTTGATFGLATLAFLFNRKRYAIILAIIALVVGLSRVYLAQHFLIDITFGILFGTLSTFLGGVTVDKYINKDWSNKNLISFNKQKN